MRKVVQIFLLLNCSFIFYYLSLDNAIFFAHAILHNPQKKPKEYILKSGNLDPADFIGEKSKRLTIFPLTVEGKTHQSKSV